MTYIKSYKELIVWQKGVQLVAELYGLTSQIRRAAVAIPSNIAEGYGRRSIKSYTQFYAIAYGSALELETQIIIAKELELADHKEFNRVERLLTEVSKMLNAMITKMKQLKASS